MKKYRILFTKQALKDVQSLSLKLKNKLKDILMNVIVENPYCGKKLLGKLDGNYSYRLDFKNRIVYSVNKPERIIYVKRARTHYGE